MMPLAMGLKRKLHFSEVDTYMLRRDIRLGGYESKLPGNIHLWRRRRQSKACRWHPSLLGCFLGLFPTKDCLKSEISW